MVERVRLELTMSCRQARHGDYPDAFIQHMLGWRSNATSLPMYFRTGGPRVQFSRGHPCHELVLRDIASAVVGAVVAGRARVVPGTVPAIAVHGDVLARPDRAVGAGDADPCPPRG